MKDIMKSLPPIVGEVLGIVKISNQCDEDDVYLICYESNTKPGEFVIHHYSESSGLYWGHYLPVQAHDNNSEKAKNAVLAVFLYKLTILYPAPK